VLALRLCAAHLLRLDVVRLLNKSVGFVRSAHSRLLARLHPLDFLFHRAEPHLGPTP
jgi:hypothetical protein